MATRDEAEQARPWLAARIEGTELVVARGEGGWFAVQGRCTHAGCAFADDASLEDATIVCNCHGSEFDVRTGEVLAPPARLPVKVYPVRVEGDALHIEV